MNFVMRYILLLFIVPGIFLLSCKGNKAEQPIGTNPEPPYAWTTFCTGVDMSYVNELQDYGVVYRDSGVIVDPFMIMKNHGANTVRVRLWHNPAWVGELTGGKIYSDLKDAAKTISRAKSAGMAVNLDFHYSDTWADGGHQETPAAWAGLDLETLKDSVYNYTLKVLNYLKRMDLTPEMVQVGNETNMGMLFPAGQVQNNNWKQFAGLLNAAIRAVRDFSAASDIKPRIILHVAQLQFATWWMDGVVNKGGVSDFDIVGISHYSKWSTIKSMGQISQIISSIRATYGKQVMIVETAYPWTSGDADTYANLFGKADSISGYPLTTAGQLKYLKDLTQAVITGGGTGIMYWEPAWITSSMKDKWGTGSSWDNCTLFDVTGNTLHSMDFMRLSYKFQ